MSFDRASLADALYSGAWNSHKLHSRGAWDRAGQKAKALVGADEVIAKLPALQRTEIIELPTV